jgi:hypothetical protein
MKLGTKKSFDETGTSYPCISNFKNSQYLFYTGWSQRGKEPFLNTLGYAKFNDRLKKIGPIYLNSNLGSIREIGSIEIKEFNDTHFMFFTQFNKWQSNSPTYNIRAAKSHDVNSWTLDKSFNFDEIDEISSMICRPSVLMYKSEYFMFFCHRKKDMDYKIGLASSANFYDWTLRSKDIFEKIPPQDWCKDGQAYPHVHYDSQTDDCYLFFAGNSYGRDGFGVLHFNLYDLTA